MSKDYHITQEQALEIANELELIKENYRGVDTFNIDGLHKVINRVLDRALGEPVGMVKHQLAQDGKCGHVAWFQSTQSMLEDTKLYAPKELP